MANNSGQSGGGVNMTEMQCLVFFEPRTDGKHPKPIKHGYPLDYGNKTEIEAGITGFASSVAHTVFHARDRSTQNDEELAAETAPDVSAAGYFIWGAQPKDVTEEFRKEYEGAYERIKDCYIREELRLLYANHSREADEAREEIRSNAA
jgi:hypothetical protein